MKNLFGAVIGTAALLCLAPAAGHAQDRETVQARVRYADLDLATPAGQDALRLRVHHAASAICVSKLDGPEGSLDRARCMREVENDGNVQIAALAHPDIQLASAKNR